MAITWFKLHHEMPDDIKLRRFSPQEKWAWVVLLCLASKSSERGIIGADNEDIAEYCEFNSTQDWLYYRDKLIAKGMIEIVPSGIKILHWEDRQYDKPSDRPEAVKVRVARHRAKKKNSQASTETPCNALQTLGNADVTPQTRSDQTRSDQTRSDQRREESESSKEFSSPDDFSLLEIRGLDDSEQPLSKDDYPSHSEAAAASVLKTRFAQGLTSSPLPHVNEKRWSDTHNRYKPTAWHPMAGMGRREWRAVRELISRLGNEEQALKQYALALSWVRVGGESMAWYRDRSTFGMWTLVNPDRLYVLNWAKAAEESQVNPDAIVDSGMKDAAISSSMARHDNPMAQLRRRISANA